MFGIVKDEESTYEFAQLHFHSPSEHTINGKRYDAEVHFVHTDGDKYLVIGVLFDTTKVDTKYPADDFLDDFDWKDLGDKDVDIGAKYFLNEIEDREFYHYSGSLTTPPCTETVSWFVYDQVQYIDPNDLSYLQKTLGRETYRVVQSLNVRTVYMGHSQLMSFGITLLAFVGASLF